LIWAGNSLPFCRPDHFEALWGKIRTAVNPGGRFAGDLFGFRHAWLAHENMNFHAKASIMDLLEGMELEYMIEEEGLMHTAFDGYQPWHSFAICAQKLHR
jgi:hypothetical protein